MNRNALIIIDVQKGLFNRKIQVYNEGELLLNISTLINLAHLKDAPVFFVQQSTKNLLSRNSDNWQLHPHLQPGNKDIFIEKQFASAFKKTDLKKLLDERNVKKIVIAGLATHQCIKSTCIEANKLGFEVILAKDGHSSSNKNAARIIDEWNEKLSNGTVEIKLTEEIKFL